MIIQVKATKQYFPMVVSIMLYKVVLTFESMGKKRKCRHVIFIYLSGEPFTGKIEGEVQFLRNSLKTLVIVAKISRCC